MTDRRRSFDAPAPRSQPPARPETERLRYTFRLEALTTRQLRIVLRIVGARSTEDLEDRQRIRLEAHLGTLIERYGGRRPERVRSRLLRRMMRNPHKLGPQVRKHLFDAERVYRLRLRDAGLEPDEPRDARRTGDAPPMPAGIVPVLDELAARRSQRTLEDRPQDDGDDPPTDSAAWLRTRPARPARTSERPPPTVGLPSEEPEWLIDIDPRSEPAFRFRLEHLSSSQQRAVGRWLLKHGFDGASGEQVLELECRLGALLDHVARAEAPDAVRPRRLVRLLERDDPTGPSRGLAQYVAVAVAQERRRDIESGLGELPAPLRPARGVRLTTPSFLAERARQGLGAIGARVATWRSRVLESALATRLRGVGRAASDRLAENPAIYSALLLLTGVLVSRVFSVSLFGRTNVERWYAVPGPSLLSSWLVEAGAISRFGVFALIAVLAWRAPWRGFDPRARLRPALLVVVGIMTYSVIALAPNPLFGPLLSDRLLLLLFAAASVVSPAGLPLFLTEFRLLDQQLRFPGLSSYPFLNYRFLHAPLETLLVTFIAFALLRAISKRRAWVPEVLFVAMLAVQLGRFYFDWFWSLATVGARPWSWAFGDRIGNELVAAWQLGWAPWLSEAAVVGLGSALNAASPALLAFFHLATLLVVLLLLDRRLVITIVTVLTVLQLGYLALSGVALWGVLATNLLFLALLPRDAPVRALLFGRRPGLVAAAAIVLLPRVEYGFDLAEWHSRLVTRLRVELVDTAGRATELQPSWLAPYDRALRLQLGLLSGRNTTYRGHGASAALVARFEEAARDPRKAAALFGPEAARRAGGWAPLATVRQPFDDLLQQTFGVERSGAHWPGLPLRSTHPLVFEAAPAATQWQRARIVRTVTFWTRNGIEVLEEDLVRTVDLRARDQPARP